MAGAQRIREFAKTADVQAKYGKGIVEGADGGFAPAAGYAEASGAIKYGEKSGEKKAELEYNPQIKSAEKSAESRAATSSELNERLASFPQLEDTVEQLGKLAEKATFSLPGRGIGAVMNQAGVPRESDIARTEYISLVDNQILPLLRQTFGAQFTQKEGESLKITLGDPDKSPEQKKAVLRSFIQQKAATIESMQRQLGQKPTGPNLSGNNAAPQGATVIGTSGGKKVYKLPDGSHVMEQ
jgi:hypothetical protein